MMQNMSEGNGGILDVSCRRQRIRTIRRALQEQFSSSSAPVAMRVKDWEKTLTIRSLAKSTRNMCEADCFTFRATLRCSRRTTNSSGALELERLEAACFVKFAWKTSQSSYGAFTERKLIGQDIEPLLERGLTPCLPFAMHEFKVPNDAGLAAWGLYRDIIKKSIKAKADDEPSRISTKKHVYLFAMEVCGEKTLAEYLSSTQGTEGNDIVQIFLMIVHCLGVLAKAGISHNDLHLQNITVCKIKPTTVCFGGRVFTTSHVPILIDWDMGCSTRRRNKSLVDYNYVGIFDAHNPLFDLFGVVKSLIWRSETFPEPAKARTIMANARTSALISTLKAAFEPVVTRHPWLFSFKFKDCVGDSFASVQQTPFSRGGGNISVWPSDVYSSAPSFDGLQATLHGLIEGLDGPSTTPPSFCFK